MKDSSLLVELWLLDGLRCREGIVVQCDVCCDRVRLRRVNEEADERKLGKDRS